MKLTVSLTLFGAAFGHYTFPGLIYNGVTAADWSYVRQTTNYQSHGPVQDVTSSQMRCYELSPGTGAPKTQTVAAGDKVGFRVDPDIQHPGPLQFYLAKVPSGSKAASWAGDGNVWFKIYQDGPGFTSSGLTWPTQGTTQSNGPTTVNVTIPSCIAPGDYLLRVEHIALHSAGQQGGAQFYIACGQLTVTGSGTKTFNGVAFPGAYKATDPGILINIYYPVPTSYTNPGPAVVSC
ncbi:lytic polysaccharide monooxygenase [Xylariaceae sp. FL1651]|nr:lytic polysaccharide monooxygenase [Xylariaceae sp. FL1651]